MRCPHCGRETPEGHYCVNCGAHLSAAETRHDPTKRPHVFALNPNEHVYHPGVVSTFFPHLNPYRTQQFRWVLMVLAALVLLLVAGRYIPIAIVAAALIVPALYLVYFFVVEVYENEPVSVIALTFVAGGVLGALLNLVFYNLALRGPLALRIGVQGLVPQYGYLILSALIEPLVGQMVMLVGPLILFFVRPRLNEVLDGLVFGVASGLGFATAQSVILYWLLITGALQPAGSTVSWALPIIRIAFIMPLLYAAATGLICAVLWLQRDPTAPRRAMGPLASLPVAIVIALSAQILPAVAVTFYGGQVLNLIWYGAAVIALMLIVRHVLHVGLIEKASALGHGGTLKCPHCLHTVPDVPFCPNCGIALRSVARRHRRTVSAPEAASGESGQSS
jgi:RsiW-degrading membrane proteinase PrsW (M82 family)